ncbi:MAG: hypothetical protein CVV28_06350 [Methanobacteriales archaeon HGW-Methanobacteriales-1]|jgi:PKD repeat protein|nr:MAG: hypothetical protein CVV28_06350 [Methanobacteriales archaeon HGW-Methanobacteriales-1]
MQKQILFLAIIFALLLTFSSSAYATDVPVANFTANVTNSSAPANVQFNDTSTGNATAWFWEFGNGKNSSEQNPQHNYTQTGNFTVSLNASNVAGSSKITKTDLIEVTCIPLSNYSNIYVNVANDEGVSFNTTGNGTYYIQSLPSANGGFNAVHIANNATATLNYGSYTITSNQSGVFFATDTGGRGYQDNVVLMVAINGTISDNFALHITAYGYNWTPTGVMNAAPTLSAINNYGITLNETFYKNDLIYGLQNWKPTGGNANYPIYVGQDMNDTSNMFYLMFIDLNAGLLGSNYPGGNSQFENNGAVKIEYSFENLGSFAAFNIYAWNWNTTQGQGMLWTNSIQPGNTGGPSGFAVNGIPAPVANFTSNVVNGTSPLTIHFTDTSVGLKPLTYEWDFNNDGTVDSTEENPTHTYALPGTYTVRLNVSSAYVSSEIIKTNYILVSNLDIRAPDVSANLSDGYYNISQSVSLNVTDDNDPNPQIYYTLNGTEPDTNSTLYTGPIDVNVEGTTVLKFIAVDSSGNIASTATRTYIIDTEVPIVIVSPAGGTFNITQNVTLNCSDLNLKAIYYTLDGSDPRIDNLIRSIYSAPIAIHNNSTIKFAALDLAGNWSPLYAENYTMVDFQAPVASADLQGGSYYGDQVVNLIGMDELDSAPKIYYTTNGTDPTTNSTLYDWPISINTIGTTILKFIAVDNAGHISDIVTMTYNLDKASAGGTWVSKVLDNDILYNSIVFDSKGYVHISYFQTATSNSDPKLKHIYQDASGWHMETIDQSKSGSGFYVSLALDSLDRPYVAYKSIFGNNNTTCLKYAVRCDNGSWNITTLTSGYSGNAKGDDVSYINLVFYQNQPKISYYNETSYLIEYLYLNGTQWVMENVNFKAMGGRWNTLAFDSNGTHYISFYDALSGPNQGSLRIAKRINGIWAISIVDDSVNAGMWNSLAFDSSGNPVISYITGTAMGGALKYAYWNGSRWISETVDSLKSVSCKLIIDEAGSPRIVYLDAINFNLKYAFKEGSKWIISYVDTVDGGGHWISLALDKSGVPVVSYESANGKLKYAYLVPFNASSNPSGGNYSGIQTVTLYSTSGTTLYYTLDGSDPRTSATRLKYSTSLTMKGTITLKFAAMDEAGNWNSVHTETYIINDSIVPTVSVNIKGGLYNTYKIVSLSMSENGTIYYTTDRSNPSVNSKRYTGSIKISSTSTLKFMAIDDAGNISPVYSQIYTIDKTRPKVSYTYPKNKATKFSRTSKISIKFSEKIKASINWSKIVVKNKYGKKVKISKSISGNMLYIKTSKRSSYSYYTVYILYSAIKDYAGNNIASTYSFKFKTGR